MTIPWHHSPVHLFVPDGIYFVTGGTLKKKHFYDSPARLELLQESLLGVLEKHEWIVHAWAVFVNHYHFIAKARGNTSLDALIEEFHSIAAIEINRFDGINGRQVWYQYWDVSLTFEKSWLVRLNYVNNNAVHHGLVKTSENYPYCSASWFQQKAYPTFSRKVRSFRYDHLKIFDDF